MSLNRFILYVLLGSIMSLQALAQTIICPEPNEVGRVFPNIGNSYYWQAQEGDTLFISNARTDRSEQMVSFLADQSYMNGSTPVCAYQVSIFRNNQLVYRTVYLNGSNNPQPQLTPAQQQQQAQDQQARTSVTQGALSSTWVTPSAHQNNSQSLVPPPASPTTPPLPQYNPGY